MEKWRLTGKSREEYDYSTIATGAADERASGFIGSKQEVTRASGDGALVLPFDLDAMKGKRVHFSAAVKTDTVDGWAGLWMQFDRKPNEDIIVLDNYGQLSDYWYDEVVQLRDRIGRARRSNSRMVWYGPKRYRPSGDQRCTVPGGARDSSGV